MLKSITLLANLVFAIIFTASALAADISMLSNSPYEDEDEIRQNILQECTKLGSKLSSFTQSFAKKKGININLVDSLQGVEGKTLTVHMTDAVSSGNAFIGHRKFVEIEGTLWENGKKIASFKGQRSSGGGAFAGYKSSCSVLGRCVKTLGKDIARWLENPVDKARIGE